MDGRRYGLDYGIVFRRLDDLAKDDRMRWERLFSDIRVLEAAAITAGDNTDND